MDSNKQIKTDLEEDPTAKFSLKEIRNSVEVFGFLTIFLSYLSVRNHTKNFIQNIIKAFYHFNQYTKQGVCNG